MKLDCSILYNMKLDHSKQIDKSDVELSAEKRYRMIEEDCNSFLKTFKGLQYLRMKYPTLSIIQAINEYKINAAWIDSIV